MFFCYSPVSVIDRLEKSRPLSAVGGAIGCVFNVAALVDSAVSTQQCSAHLKSRIGCICMGLGLFGQLDEFFSSGKVNGVIEAEVEVTEPKYSKEFLQKNIKKLSSFTTVSTNGANGNHNMELSLKQCNNSIINPGETWSFNKCTGNSNLTSNGYKSAGVIINGKMENGIGGGICQCCVNNVRNDVEHSVLSLLIHAAGGKGEEHCDYKQDG